MMIVSSFCFEIISSTASPGLPTVADGPSALRRNNFLPSYSVSPHTVSNARAC